MDNLAYKLQRQERVTQREQTQQSIGVKPQRRSRITAGEKLILTTLVIASLVAGILLINNYASIYTLDHTIQSMETQVNETSKTIDELQLKVEELSAPERIMDIAKNELGMSLNEKNVQVINP